MNKEKAIRFAGLMEDYLNIPSFVCEMIQQQLEENKYKEVVEYVVQRRNEIESKPEFISDRNAITMLVNQNEEKDKEISDLDDLNRHLHNELKQKEEIIKEAREYIKRGYLINTKDLLKILERENKDENNKL